MSYVQTMAVGDTGPAYRITARNGSGAALDLTGATVEFLVYRGSDTKPRKVFSGTGYVHSPVTSQTVRYDFGANDLQTIGVGDYRVRFRVTLLDGTTETWPEPEGEELHLHIVPAV